MLVDVEPTVVSKNHRSRSHMTLGERRARNRSLCSVLCSPPPYGLAYSAWMGNLSQLKLEDITAAEREFSLGPPPDFIRSCYEPSSNDLSSPMSLMSVSYYSPRRKSSDEEIEKIHRQPSSQKSGSSNPSASSGYGSASSESDQEITPAPFSTQVTRRSRFTSKAQRELEKSRRSSVPATLRPAYSDDVMRVLEKEGYVHFETNVDSGVRMPVVDMRSVRQNESVLDLARKFAELSAQQEKSVRSHYWQKPTRSGPTTPIQPVRTGIVGGIASLGGMSGPNPFRTLPKASYAAKTSNPTSIKNQLLRWIQLKLKDYPIEINNFSTSWANGVAFCALIHRFAPNSFDFAKIDPKKRRENFELAFKVAEDNGVCALLEVDDMILMGDNPDYKCVFTYVQQFYVRFKNSP